MESLNSRHVALIAGGTIGEWALPLLQEEDYMLVGADRGALFLVKHGLIPDAALGDFDSVTSGEKELIRQHSRLFLDCDAVDKNWTDTEWALEWALEQKPRSLLLLGATGTRLDHSLANIQLLKRALDRGVACRIADAHNDIRLLAGGECLRLPKGDYAQVSLLPFAGVARGITLEGFLYPLVDAVLETGQSLGISNVIAGEEGLIRLEEGLLLVIRSRD